MRVLVTTHLDADDLRRLRDAFPQMEMVEAYEKDAIRAALPGCSVLFTSGIAQELYDSAAELRWVQARSAGINGYPLQDFANRGIALTTGSGAHGTPIAENILAMMFAFAIRLPQLVRAQEK